MAQNTVLLKLHQKHLGGVVKPDTQGFLGNGPGATLQRTLMKSMDKDCPGCCPSRETSDPDSFLSLLHTGPYESPQWE